MPDAIAAAEPPLDPPAVLELFHGFRQWSPNRFFVSPSNPNSGVFVLPNIMAPADFILLTTTESESGMKSLCIRDPDVVFRFFVSSRSLIPIGIPCNSPV